MRYPNQLHSLRKTYPALFPCGIIFALLFISFGLSPISPVVAIAHQQLEDAVTATIYDAVGAVGGEFVISGSSTGVNARWDIGFPLMPDVVIYRQDISILITENPDTFNNGTSTFYGMPAYIDDNGMNGSMVFWSPGKIAGTDFYLEFHTELATFRPTEGIDYLSASVMAEALHQAALANGLYDFVANGSELSAPTIETVPQPPEAEPPAEMTSPTDADAEGLIIPDSSIVEGDNVSDADNETDFEGAWQSQAARGIRSAALPILGGLIGAGIAWLGGVATGQAAGAAGSVVSRPVATSANSQVPPPIEPPALPPLSAEEIHAQEMRRQGMVWSDSAGWQTPDQVRQSVQWQQNNQAVVAAEDAAWRSAIDAERAELEENAKRLKKEGEDLDTNLKLIDFTLKMREVNRELLKKNHYVFNPNQGIPVWDTLTQGKNWAWDKVFGTKGLTCEGYVDAAKARVKQIASEVYGPDAQVMTTKFDEKSSIMPREGWFSPGAWKDWCDGFLTDNHVLIRVDLPNKTELAVDFHQHNTGKRPPVVRPLDDARKDWKVRIGEHEFTETVTER